MPFRRNEAGRTFPYYQQIKYRSTSFLISWVRYEDEVLQFPASSELVHDTRKRLAGGLNHRVGDLRPINQKRLCGTLHCPIPSGRITTNGFLHQATYTPIRFRAGHRLRRDVTDEI